MAEPEHGFLNNGLNKDIEPEDVFDLKEKLGEGSYGSVYKAVHRVSKSFVAIKKVPLDADLQVDFVFQSFTKSSWTILI